MEPGVRFVMIGGIITMLMLHVVNLDSDSVLVSQKLSMTI